jgi:release factor glutamine methyltransferase
MNLSEVLDWGANYLRRRNIDDSRLEAEILLAHALGSKRSALIIRHHESIESNVLSLYQACLRRRSQHEPTAYITGIQPFMALDFFVNRSVLIPRPETEQLVEIAINAIKSSLVIADIGTGSGAIAVSLAKNLPEVSVVGIDSSRDAIGMAKRNAEYHAVENRCQFIVGNLFEPLAEKVNFIVSNPPYVPTAEIEKLQPEVKDWEPRPALDGGKDGLDYIRKIIQDSPGQLKENGCLILEFGSGQAKKIRELAKDLFREINVFTDYSNKERIFLAKL